MFINMGGKFTDIKLSLIKMLQSYKNIRVSIQKLTNKCPKHLNDIQPLIRQLNNLNRVSQREMKHYTQLQLIYELESMLRKYIDKKYCKIRRFDVYSHASCYLDVLTSKISQFMPKSMKICAFSPEMLKWKFLLSQINENKQILYFWLKQSGKQAVENLNHQKSKSKYKFSTCMTKANTPTTNYSCSQSLAGEFVQFQSKIQSKPHSFLKRCQTAKPQIKNSTKKHYPINVRSPSANQFINRQSEKEQIPHRKLTRKPIKKKLFYKFQIQPCRFDSSIEIIQLKQNNLESSKIQQKNIKEKESQQRKAQEKKPFYENTAQETFYSQKEDLPTVTAPDKLFQTVQYYKSTDTKNHRRSSTRKFKNLSQTQNFKSSFSKENFIQALQTISQPSSNEQQNSVLDQMDSSERQKKKETKRGRNFVNGTDVDQVDQNNLQQQILPQPQNQDESQEKNLFSKSTKDFLPRKPMIQPSFQSQNLQSQTKEKKTQRRIGIISSKQIVSALKRIQIKQKQEEKEKQQELKKKAIEFNTNLISEMQNGEEELTQVEYENQIELHPVTRSKVDQFYQELAKIKKDQINAAKLAPFGDRSIFFLKQDLLREEKSRQLQRHLRKLKARHASMGEMFQLRSQETNKKVDNYMVVERRFAFEADSEWIKQNFTCKQIRDSYNEQQLIQKQSCESWSINEVQEI